MAMTTCPPALSRIGRNLVTSDPYLDGLFQSFAMRTGGLDASGRADSSLATPGARAAAARCAQAVSGFEPPSPLAHPCAGDAGRARCLNHGLVAGQSRAPVEPNEAQSGQAAAGLPPPPHSSAAPLST